VRSGRSTRRTRTSLMASLSLLSLSTLSPSGPSCSARAFSDSRPPPRAPAGAGALRAVRGAVSVQRCNAAVLHCVQSRPRRCGGRGATCAREPAAPAPPRAARVRARTLRLRTPVSGPPRQPPPTACAAGRPVRSFGRRAVALHTHPDTQDTNSAEWHFYFRILWGADGSQQSICDTHTPQTRDRTSLALMLLSVLAQHAWSMGSG
jgi:hypothetical protein